MQKAESLQRRQRILERQKQHFGIILQGLIEALRGFRWMFLELLASFELSQTLHFAKNHFSVLLDCSKKVLSEVLQQRYPL